MKKSLLTAKICTNFDICKKKSLSTLAKALSEPINNKNLQMSKIFCSIAKVKIISEICK